MIEVLLTSLLIVLIFTGLGEAVSCVFKSEDNLMQTLIIGVAALIVILNFPIRYWPAKQIFWPLFAFLAVISLVIICRSKKSHPWGERIYLYAVLLVGFALRLWFSIVDGDLTTIEPTPNHDDIYYIFTSSWLSENAFGSLRILTDNKFPYQYSAPINSQVLPRVGAESITAFAANIFNIKMHVAYSILNALAFSILSVGILNIAAVDIRDKKEVFFKYLIIAITPSLGFVWANNNFPTLWGLLLVCGIQYQLSQVKMAFQKADIIKVSLLISALVCTYPELLTIAVFIFAFFIAFSNGSSFKYKILGMFFAGVLSILLVPLAYVDIIHVAKTTISATNSSGGFSLNYMGALVLPYQLMDYLSASNGFFSPVWQYSISICFLLFLMTAGSKETHDIYGLITGCMLLVFYMFLRNDSYGLMKAIEFAVLPISIIASRLIYNSVGAVYELKVKS